MEEILPVPSYLISVNVCSISKVKASDIVIYFARSFLLRLPRKIASPPKGLNCKSNKSFHFPWFSVSRYFFIQLNLRALLNINHP